MKIILAVKNIVSNAILIDIWGKKNFCRHSSKDPLGSLFVPWSDVSFVLGQKKSNFVHLSSTLFFRFLSILKSRLYGILTRFFAFLGRIATRQGLSIAI
jgi:hypothetical protein